PAAPPAPTPHPAERAWTTAGARELPATASTRPSSSLRTTTVPAWRRRSATPVPSANPASSTPSASGSEKASGAGAPSANVDGSSAGGDGRRPSGPRDGPAVSAPTIEHVGGWPRILGRLVEGEDLQGEEAAAALASILAGDATAAKLAAFIVS